MGRIDNFKDLDIWVNAKNMAVNIYKITSYERFKHDFNLKDQLRRSIVSISSNIAEGFGRKNNKEFVHFLLIARGSCSESITQIIIAEEIGYLSRKQRNDFEIELERLNNNIGKFITYLKKPKIINK